MIRSLIVFSIVLAACFMAPRMPGFVAWDQSAMAAVVGIRSDELTRFFRTVTDIGGTYGFLVFLFFGFSFFLFHRRIPTAFTYLVGVGLLKLSTSLVKIAIARPRPPGGLEYLATWSMPSGHAANAVLMFGVLGVFCWKRISSPVLRIFALFFCFAAILLIDLSRVYLGVHYPSDVVLGSFYAVAGLLVLHSLRRDIFDFA